MSLEQASFLMQIASVVAIVAALLFVSLQIRKTVRSSRASCSQRHCEVYHSITASLIDQGEFARIWRRSLADPETIDDDERVRFFAFTTNLFRFYEASRLQWLRGQLDDELWHTIQRQAADLSTQPGIHHWWGLRRSWHSADFRAWFENLPPEPVVAIYGAPAAPPAKSTAAAAAAEKPVPVTEEQ